MAAKKQMVGKKRIKQCEDIIGLPVTSAFMNGDLPHGVALAWTGPRDAFLVHIDKDTCVHYVRSGKIVMRRYILAATRGEALKPTLRTVIKQLGVKQQMSLKYPPAQTTLERCELEYT